MNNDYNKLNEYFEILEEPVKAYFFNLLKNCVDLQLKVEECKQNTEKDSET